MKTKEFIILLLSVQLHVDGLCQNPKLKRADKFYNDMAYVKAAGLYEEVIVNDSGAHVMQRLASCYYKNHEMDKAAFWYSNLYDKYGLESTDSEDLFLYAQSLRSIGDYEGALEWTENFNRLKIKDSRGMDFAAKHNMLAAIRDPKNPIYSVGKVDGINTPLSDFGVTMTSDGVIFSSTNDYTGKSWVRRKYMWNEQGFLNLYKAKVDTLSQISNITPFLEDGNTSRHESNAVFSPDGDVMYFTANNFNNGKFKKSNNGINEFKIYRAERVQGGWENIVPLPFCSDQFSVGHPSLNKDGSRLYFSSDMPGTIGSTDIFYVDILEDGSYGSIQNMGKGVNTEGREVFPFIAEDNTLYFSSDGHFGLGGLDVFRSSSKKGSYEPAENLKAPLNSSADDFAFVMASGGREGYLSSNRKGGEGDDDIYFFTRSVLPIPCNQLVSGIVRNVETGQPISSARVFIENQEGQQVRDTIVGNTGKFIFHLPCGEGFTAFATKDYYLPDQEYFQTSLENGRDILLNLELGIEQGLSINENGSIVIDIEPIYFDFDKFDINKEASTQLNKVINIMNKYPEMEVRSSSHTDSRGTDSYNRLLSERRAKSTLEYIIAKGISPTRISGEGLGEKELTNKCTDNDTHTNRAYCSDNEHQANRRTEFVISKIH